MSKLPPFRSDNTSGIAPDILRAIQDADGGECASYGADAFSEQLINLVSTVFERRSWCFPVGTGVAANGLALSAAAPAGTKILCHHAAHIRLNEGGAAEFFTQGSALTPVAGGNGKIGDANLRELTQSLLPSEQNAWSTLSLTQLTEAGTAYTPREIAALAGIARGHGAVVHMDGARLANSVAGLECSPADTTWRAGVDILSLGATKNGAMNADAVIVFDRDIADRVSERIKRTGQVYSKMRFMAVQLLAMFSDDLWLRNARNANEMAAHLVSRVRRIEGAEVIYPVQGNQVFLRLDPELVRRMKTAGLRLWQSGTDGAGVPQFRVVTSFATTRRQVNEVVRQMEG